VYLRKFDNEAVSDIKEDDTVFENYSPRHVHQGKQTERRERRRRTYNQTFL
jgi:hypothetical protein